MTYVPLIGLLVTICIGGLGYYYFRANRQRTQLRYDVVSEPVFTSGSTAKISIDDKVVAVPYEVRLWFNPAGVKDITSSAFDQGDDVVLTLGAPLVTSPMAGDSSLKVNGEPGDRQIVIPPQMLKCGSLVYASMIVDGEPTTDFRAPIADVDIVKFDVADAGRQTLAGWVRSQPGAAVGGLAVTVAAAAVAVSVFSAANERSEQERAAAAAVDRFSGILAGAAAEAFGVGGLVGGEQEGGHSAADARLEEIIRRAVDEALDARGIPSAPVPGGPTTDQSERPDVPSLTSTPRP